MDNHEKDMIIAEFKEAWLHYRHVENNRTKYLGFFFTIILTSIGFIVTILYNDGKFVSPNQPVTFGLLILVWFLNVITTFIYTAVFKVRFVLYHYEAVLKSTRTLIYGISDYNKFTNEFDVRENIGLKRFRNKVFSFQDTAVMILAVSALLLGIILISAIVPGSCLISINKIEQIIISIITVPLLVLQIYIACKVIKEHYYKSNKKQNEKEAG